ncbi:Angiotensin-converting enzyme [Popillia japonica]|uniref:Angiotensin-converting enzyme n=1 Tax=Popillia japonica TaxID=7064 RepID=A0AAW1L9H1_POPJA
MAVSYIQYLSERQSARHKRDSEGEWAYASNITEYNLKNKVTIGTQVADEAKQDWLETTKYHWKSFRNLDLRRQFKKYTDLGVAALPTKKFEKYSKTLSEMEKIYATAKLCDFHNSSKCDLYLEPEITHILSTSRDPDELKNVWIEWRKAIGPKVKDMFETYVNLVNEAARLNNFTVGPKVKDMFETEQFHNLWEQIKPLYLQIHAYVRNKLRQKYGDIVSEKGPIPAHLLGNMWAQTWSNIADISLPYPNITSPTVTQEMINQGYTPLKMFQTANDFFVSLNLTAMPGSFWEKSILEKPSDGRELICHASAWDFFDNDVRIKQCTDVTEEDLYTAHHEMGHIEYFLQYASQPVAYREGANSGFHEAVGDVISLSVSTPKHLQKIGLLNQTNLDAAALLNNLYKTGLDKIVFLPFGYLMDLWRWDVFAGKIPKSNWNCKWWELRHDYQGVEPPVDRSEDDFDPAAKYHIIANVPYIRYFVSFVIQFQFHRALCLKAGDYVPDDPNKPLHNCDIYQSTTAGNALGDMLQMGSSKPWPDAMEVLTGQRNMDASGLLEYFKPLQTWLEEENNKNGVFIGWEPTQRVCSSTKKENQELETSSESS